MYEGDSVYDTGCFKRIFKEHEYEFEYKNVHEYEYYPTYPLILDIFWTLLYQFDLYKGQFFVVQSSTVQ